MLDDEMLGTLLRQAGDSFTVPATGADEILQRIYGHDDPGAQPTSDTGTGAGTGTGTGTGEPRLPRRWAGAIRSHRALSVAAALIVLAVIAVSVTLTSSAGRTTDAGHAPVLPLHASSNLKATSQGAARLAAPSASASPSASGAADTPASGTGTGSSGSTTSPLPAGEVGQPARIEQTGTLDLTVQRGELSATMTKLTSLAGEYGGFVASSQTQSGSGSGQPSGTVTLQIPVASFSAALADAQALGKTSQLSTRATDVTGQYVDLQDQITALEASRQQYLTIMTRASTIGDILAVQAQLDSLQSQIQQLQGQLQLLTSETAYSTLAVTATEPGPRQHHPVPAHSSSLAKAWHDSVHGFIVGIEGLVRIAGPILFVLLCLGALVVGGRLSWRRLQRRNL